MLAVTKKQGSVRGESIDGTNRTSDSETNNTLSASEDDVLKE